MDSRLAFYNCNHFRDRVYLYEEESPSKSKIIVITNIYVQFTLSLLMQVEFHMWMLLLFTSQKILLRTTKVKKALTSVIWTVKRKIRLLWADVKGPVLNSFKLSGIAERLGRQNFFLTVQEAVDFALKEEKIQVCKALQYLLSMQQDLRELQEREAAQKKEENPVVALDESDHASLSGNASRTSMDERRSVERKRKESLAEKILKGQSAFIDKLQEKMNPEVDFWKGEKIDAWV